MSSNTHSRGDFNVDRRLLKLCAMALPVGLSSVGLGYILLKAIALFTNIFFFGVFSFSQRAPAINYGWWTALVPAAGGLIIGLMARYGSEKIRGHGIPEAIEVILYGKSEMSPKVAVLKPLSSAISIGSGGPFGAEGPIIMTSGAFGSLFAQKFKLSPAERKTILVAGAAAGMTAIFGTPLAAILIAVELLLFEWRPRSLIPVSIACASAFILRPFVMEGSLPLFPIPQLPQLSSQVIATAFPVGLCVGVLAWAVSTTLYKAEDQFARLPIHWSWWPSIGGLFVGIIGCIEPRVLGVGYDLINTFLQGTSDATSALRIVILKAAAWIIALASGTSGGVLAPLLIIGSGFGQVANQFCPGPSALWPLVAMTAMIGGIMRAPLTAVLFAIEITHDVNALPALIVASISSYLVTVLIMKRSILTEKIARRGLEVVCEFGVDHLDRQNARSIMTTQIDSIGHDWSVSKVLDFFQSDERNHRGYPIIDSNHKLLGIVTKSDALQWSKRDAGVQLSELLSNQTLVVCHPDDTIRTVAERIVLSGVGRVPVVESHDSMKLVGLITRGDLLHAMRSHHMDESVVL